LQLALAACPPPIAPSSIQLTNRRLALQAYCPFTPEVLYCPYTTAHLAVALAAAAAAHGAAARAAAVRAEALLAVALAVQLSKVPLT
jgi:hypothetical protein